MTNTGPRARSAASASELDFRSNLSDSGFSSLVGQQVRGRGRWVWVCGRLGGCVSVGEVFVCVCVGLFLLHYEGNELLNVPTFQQEMGWVGRRCMHFSCLLVTAGPWHHADFFAAICAGERAGRTDMAAAARHSACRARGGRHPQCSTGRDDASRSYDRYVSFCPRLDTNFRGRLCVLE